MARSRLSLTGRQTQARAAGRQVGGTSTNQARIEWRRGRQRVFPGYRQTRLVVARFDPDEVAPMLFSDRVGNDAFRPSAR